MSSATPRIRVLVTEGDLYRDSSVDELEVQFLRRPTSPLWAAYQVWKIARFERRLEPGSLFAGALHRLAPRRGRTP